MVGEVVRMVDPAKTLDKSAAGQRLVAAFPFDWVSKLHSEINTLITTWENERISARSLFISQILSVETCHWVREDIECL